jgi:hypothetical protein
MRTEAQIKRDRARTGAYWERRERRKARYNPEPALIYPLKTPMLFDCRFSTERRMGIGDQICLIAALQAVAKKTGGGVSVLYDADYPASETLFKASGLPCTTRKPSGVYTTIPHRHHLFESAINGVVPLHGEQTGCPVSQPLFNFGWSDAIPTPPFTLQLSPNERDIETAQKITGGHNNIIACSPLEISRGNSAITPQVWREVLREAFENVPRGTIALFGCSTAERGKMKSFIRDIRLDIDCRIVTESIGAWLAIIQRSRHYYTGNTSGMWLAMATQTPTTVMQTPERHLPHNRMWNYKPSWGFENVHTRFFPAGTRHSLATSISLYTRAQGQKTIYQKTP